MAIKMKAETACCVIILFLIVKFAHLLQYVLNAQADITFIILNVFLIALQLLIMVKLLE